MEEGKQRYCSAQNSAECFFSCLNADARVFVLNKLYLGISIRLLKAFQIMPSALCHKKFVQLLGFPLLGLLQSFGLWVIRSVWVFTHSGLNQSFNCTLQVNLFTPVALCRWRLTMETSWLQITCMKRFIPSSMPTSKRLPSPRVLPARGEGAESPGRQERRMVMIRQIDASTHSVTLFLALQWNIPDDGVKAHST